jgi:hypothetical protein
LIERFGTSDAATLGLWVPLTEEAIKLIPVAVVLFAALRRSDRRPSALDVMLLGAWAGAGFAIYESATFGPRYILADRRACDLVLLSDGGPRAGVRLAGRASRATSFTRRCWRWESDSFFLYRKRVRRAWIAPAVAAFASLLEHTSQNAITDGRSA